jgi:antitoxin VapB
LADFAIAPPGEISVEAHRHCQPLHCSRIQRVQVEIQRRRKSTYIYCVMALSIKDPEADRLAREVAKATGETLTMAVVRSLRERLARVRRPKGPRLSEELLKIGRRCASLSVQDSRSADEIVGYDENGPPR